jgi:hypothetical protein
MVAGQVQNDHVDRGCRITEVHGIDYRCTTIYGLASNQFPEHDRWAGWDIPMAYGGGHDTARGGLWKT